MRLYQLHRQSWEATLKARIGPRRWQLKPKISKSKQGTTQGESKQHAFIKPFNVMLHCNWSFPGMYTGMELRFMFVSCSYCAVFCTLLLVICCEIHWSKANIDQSSQNKQLYTHLTSSGYSSSETSYEYVGARLQTPYGFLLNWCKHISRLATSMQAGFEI